VKAKHSELLASSASDVEAEPTKLVVLSRLAWILSASSGESFCATTMC